MASSKDTTRKSKKDKSSSTSTKSTKALAAEDYKSSEFVEESEDEERSSAKKSKKNGSKTEKPNMAAKPAVRSNGKADNSTSSSGSGSDSSESEAESGSQGGSDDDESNEASTALNSTQQTAKPPASKTVSFQKATPFIPPKGFESKRLDGESYKSSKMFKESNMEGKQIWYITAPASVPISAIEEVSLKAMKKGKAALTHNGEDYGFVEDTEDKTYTKILVPNGSEDGYKATSKAVDQVLHLRHIVQLPSIHGKNDEGSISTSSRATVPTRKPIRQQPKGLKMRFTPIGFGSGIPGVIGLAESDDDVEMEDASLAQTSNLGGDAQEADATPIEKSRKRKSKDGEKTKSKKSK